MPWPLSTALRSPWLALAAGALTLAAGCGGDRRPAGSGEAAAGGPSVLPASPAATAGADAPDTRDMGAFVLAKINANPGIAGTATLVEFRQTSVATQPLGNKSRSAVVEFEGIVTFSGDVSWSWQGPTRAGAPQKFEARASTSTRERAGSSSSRSASTRSELRSVPGGITRECGQLVRAFHPANAFRGLHLDHRRLRIRVVERRDLHVGNSRQVDRVAIEEPGPAIRAEMPATVF